MVNSTVRETWRVERWSVDWWKAAWSPAGLICWSLQSSAIHQREVWSPVDIVRKQATVNGAATFQKLGVFILPSLPYKRPTTAVRGVEATDGDGVFRVQFCASLYWLVGLIIPFNFFGGAGHPNVNFWHVRTPMTVTHSGCAKFRVWVYYPRRFQPFWFWRHRKHFPLNHEPEEEKEVKQTYLL